VTQSQLDAAVACATGESVRTVRGRGFGPDPGPADGPGPGALYLAVDCPTCGGRCPLAFARGGAAALAESPDRPRTSK
jgi:hypothetical protein